MKDKDQEEEEGSKGDSGDEDDGYLLEEINCESHTSHPPGCHINNSVSTLNILIL